MSKKHQERTACLLENDPVTLTQFRREESAFVAAATEGSRSTSSGLGEVEAGCHGLRPARQLTLFPTQDHFASFTFDLSAEKRRTSLTL
jgi:hypothetical protein